MKKQLLMLIAISTFIFASCEKDIVPESEFQGDVDLKSAQKVTNFRTHLAGENEVPYVETLATGQAVFQLSKDGTGLHYKLIASNIENVLMAHIHLAPKDSNGPVAAWLYPSSAPPSLISGRFSGVLAEGVITGADLVGPLAGKSLDHLINEIKDGNAYVNVHTTQNPPGEIRGQIEGNIPKGKPF